MRELANAKGYILGMTLILAFVFAIVAYANLMLAVSQAEHRKFAEKHPNASYAAEAGVVIARERLIRNRDYCGPTGTGVWTQQVDSDGDGAVTAADLTVEITINNCGASNSQTISAKVVY